MAINKDHILKAERARNKLEAQFMKHPDVRLIDIGLDPSQCVDAQQVVIRIHLHKKTGNSTSEEMLQFPEYMDSIPVRVIFADYSLE